MTKAFASIQRKERLQFNSSTIPQGNPSRLQRLLDRGEADLGVDGKAAHGELRDEVLEASDGARGVAEPLVADDRHPACGHLAQGSRCLGAAEGARQEFHGRLRMPQFLQAFRVPLNQYRRQCARLAG